MDKKTVFFTIFFLFPSSIIAKQTPLILEKIIAANNHAAMQQIANFLMLFVTESPQSVNNILNNETNFVDTYKAKTAALEAVQKICSTKSSLSNLKQLPLKHVLSYESTINKWYKKIFAKLDKRYRKILYGPHKGKDLPSKLYFFFKPEPQPVNLSSGGDGLSIMPLLQKLASLFC